MESFVGYYAVAISCICVALLFELLSVQKKRHVAELVLLEILKELPEGREIDGQ